MSVINPFVSRGSALLEVLITVVILGIGLLGVAGLQSRIHVMEFESYQRAQAVVILNDVAERISANRDDLAVYVAGSPLASVGSLADCNSLAGAALDLCEWGNTLKGAGEIQGSSGVGGFVGGKVCLTTFTATSTKAFSRCQTGVQVDVVWRGRSSTVVPAAACGEGEYGSDDAYRRVVSTRVGTGDEPC